MLLEPLLLLCRQDHELLVGGGVGIEGIAFLNKGGLERHGLGDGMARNVPIEIVGKERIELHAQKPPLCQHRALLLGHGHKAARRHALAKHQRLPAERADLGAADGEHVGERRHVPDRHVAGGAHEPVAQPRPVEKQRQVPPAAGLIQRRKLCLGVERPQLRGLGEVDHAGAGHVLVRRVGVEAAQIGFQLPGVELARVGRQRQHLVAGKLDRPGLVHGDVSGLGGKHGLMPPQKRRDHDKVCLRPAGKKMHVHLPAEASDLLRRTGAPNVLPIARLGYEVCAGKGFQYLRMAALGIIA